MKIVLIGYGKMGHAIETIAIKKGHVIVLRIDENNLDALTPQNLSMGDVAFEFSRPESAYENIMKCFDAGLPVVCGTTGWLEKKALIEDYCRKNKKSFFYATNYSVGVNLFFSINAHLAKLMNSQEQYDSVLLHETHHTAKLDSPSGTAITLANQIIDNIDRINRWVNYKTNENVDLNSDNKGELPIFSSREEEVPGTHIVKYFSDNDEIEIIHKALNREGFASGALMAGEWLIGRMGVYGMNDLLKL